MINFLSCCHKNNAVRCDRNTCVLAWIGLETKAQSTEQCALYLLITMRVPQVYTISFRIGVIAHWG